ncbi:Type II secretory pathway [Dinoroseobacter shibae DFL 12 = DSM 16493]|jgi:type II secretory pathway predicted ATPase ExeA|uniref:Type II secretory pathway n=2 Tax=Roseobacteraceae TaxID=2854170 RepID=A8LNM6_DINSH|nr:AAA family ATPase [Dinoroseobacter shibae]ABV95120.1 Type II secretory pathway [Dinoroseobacter shibae DFL 12 = DSM 16493]URF46534.1 AAA family ATPase [Dinoroseobacter shibae]URF50840.1 AAA family ATPase [Dinoroseobacter shibae]
MSMSGLYSDYFGLTERPFKLLPDPDFLFWSKIHKRAYAVLEYGILSGAPITVLTGEVGAGKTTLLQRLLRSIDDTVTVGLISNAQGGRGELLQWVLNALSVTSDGNGDYVCLFQRLQDFLIHEYSEGRKVILIIDEAQNLSPEGLEELRMLTNINSNKDEILQLVLVGQPQLRKMIMHPDLQQFAQRVSAFYHIPPMDRDTMGEYVQHRMKHAGGSGHEFTDQALDRIYQASEGVPRLVNKLCDFALLYTATENRDVVTASAVDEVLSDGIFVGNFDQLGEAAE